MSTVPAGKWKPVHCQPRFKLLAVASVGAIVRGLSRCRYSNSSISARKTYGTEKFHVMIVNSGTDGRVASDIGDQYAGLVAAGFSAFVGIRDAYPIQRTMVPKLRAGLSASVPAAPVIPLFILGIMEVEAWFMAEYRHFGKIANVLTPPNIRANFGIDVISDDLQLRNKPADDLHRIYGSVGFAYRKTLADINRTVSSLSMEAIYLETRTRFPDLNRLVTELDSFFS